MGGSVMSKVVNRLALFVLALSIGVVATTARTSADAAKPAAAAKARASLSTTKPDAAAKARAQISYAKLPLSFERNRGQTDARVKFLSHGHGYSLFLTPADATLMMSRYDHPVIRDPMAPMSAKATLDSVRAAKVHHRVIRTRFIGANPAPQMDGIEQLAAVSNYFIGNDKSKWHSNVPNYSKVRYRSLYPGIDLVYYGDQGHLEFDVIAAPGADPNRFRLAVDGGDKTEINSAGELVIHAGADQIVFHKPIAYQEIAHGRQSVAANFKLRSGNDVAFEIGSYDRHQPLVIDPTLVYSTYLGGSNYDQGSGIAVDGSGNAYGAGFTYSANFPVTAGAFQTTFAGGAAFVTKLNASGSALVYSTYLGGSGGAQAFGIAIDGAGNAYVTGSSGPNFPITAGAFQTTINGGFTSVAFVTKLNASGTALVYSTYLGGTGGVPAGETDAQAYGIAIDGAGNAYVTGYTLATDFPTTVGAFQTTLTGGSNAFITKLNASGTALLYSTYLGGGGDTGQGIATDGA